MSSTISNIHFPVAYKCVIGALQRIVLCVPDRAPTRILAVESLLNLLSTLHKTYTIQSQQSSNDKTPNSSKNGAKLCLDSLSHFMAFLIKLSKCTKTGYRAFSLDIVTAVLTTEWIWTGFQQNNKTTNNSNTTANNTTTTSNTNQNTIRSHMNSSVSKAPFSHNINYFDPTFLLTTLMERCSDIAPTVRMRALSTICGLCETLNDTSAPAKCDLLLSAAMGSLVVLEEDFAHLRSTMTNLNTVIESPSIINSVPTTTNSVMKTPFMQVPSQPVKYHPSLLDLFRDGANDEKPLVRSKSVQALGSALSMKWPKFRPNIEPLPLMNLTPNQTHIQSTTTNAVKAKQTNKQKHRPKKKTNNNSDDESDSNSDSSNDSDDEEEDVVIINEKVNPSLSLEYVTMFVSEDDLQTLIDKCNDSSLAVRKQALMALTDFARSRPVDITIQETWIHAVLPLVTDPESSVQMKVALSVYELIFETLIKWSNTMTNIANRNTTNSASSRVSQRLNKKDSSSNMNTQDKAELLEANFDNIDTNSFLQAAVSPTHGNSAVQNEQYKKLDTMAGVYTV